MKPVQARDLGIVLDRSRSKRGSRVRDQQDAPKPAYPARLELLGQGKGGPSAVRLPAEFPAAIRQATELARERLGDPSLTPSDWLRSLLATGIASEFAAADLPSPVAASS